MSHACNHNNTYKVTKEHFDKCFLERWKGIIGKRFKKLIILDIFKEKYYKASVLCDCGRTTKKILWHVLRGTTSNCGICQKINLVGKRFSKLTVLEKTEKRTHGKVIWRCRCDCGKETFLETIQITAKKTKSCGCMSNFWKSQAKIAEKNPNWVGDKVGYSGVHEWIKKRLPKPKYCQDCKKVPPYDLANISQKYKRDLADWEWLCRHCHMVKDGRMKNLRHQGGTDDKNV